MTNAKKNALIIGGVLVGTGVLIAAAAMFAIDFDFSKMSTVEMITETSVIDTDFSEISVDAISCNVRLLPSEDEECRIVCRQGDSYTHTAEVKNGVLEICQVDKAWHVVEINIIEEESMQIYLPKDTFNKLDIQTVSGNVDIPETFSFGDAKLQATSGTLKMKAAVTGELLTETVSGEIFIQDTDCHTISADTTSGDVFLSKLKAEQVTIQTTSGDLKLENMETGDFTLNTSSGDMRMSDLIAQDEIIAESISGNLIFDKCDGAKLDISTSSGDVKGQLLSAKTFQVKTSSGDIDVPDSVSEEICKIHTVSGDVDFR